MCQLDIFYIFLYWIQFTLTVVAKPWLSLFDDSTRPPHKSQVALWNVFPIFSLSFNFVTSLICAFFKGS